MVEIGKKIGQGKFRIFSQIVEGKFLDFRELREREQIQRVPWRQQDCGSGYQKRYWFFPWIRRVGSEIFRSEKN